MKIVITGATGFIGLALLRKLPESVAEIRVLTRDPAAAEAKLGHLLSPAKRAKLRAFAWDAERTGDTPDPALAPALEGADVIIHLAGENIGGGRWSEETKRRILSSRELGTRNLVAGINRLARPPVLISASAIGIYGNTGESLLSEVNPAGTGFLAEVCQVWEKEAHRAKTSRLVIPRFGIVLGEGGGALAKLLPLFRVGIGGRVGDGQQWMSWIHRDDLVAFLIQAMADPKISGTYNLVAPETVRNEAFVHVLGQVLHRPSIIPVPAIALKLALGEMAEETILASQRVSSEKLASLGFSWTYPNLEGALRQIAAS